ncbi:hypothetical protein LXL04_023964 [Taraxacum kok-saghyz]
MRSITISSNNVFTGLMKIKAASRHIFDRTIFHTILILAFYCPLFSSKDYDKAAIECNGREAVTNFEASTYQGNDNIASNHHANGGHCMDFLEDEVVEILVEYGVDPHEYGFGFRIRYFS